MGRGTIDWKPFAEGSEICLKRAILKIRSSRPKVEPSLPFIPYPSGEMLQLWINTPACRFSLAGNCSICDYCDGDISEFSIAKVCDYIDSHCNEYNTILLNTCGSVLCEEELPFSDLLRIADAIEKTSVKHVIFETHLAYVNRQKIEALTQVLPSKTIMLEYGQESTSTQVLRYCLCKPSVLSNQDAINLLHEYGIEMIANVVLGAPFLNVYQRIRDAADSIAELLRSGIAKVVLFPVNIKPYTLVSYLFGEGYYKRIQIAEIIKVLENFCETDLARIELAWFEPKRDEMKPYTEQSLGPELCDRCGQRILEQLRMYSKAKEGMMRKDIIDKLQCIDCSCIASLYEYEIPNIHKCYSFLEENV